MKFSDIIFYISFDLTVLDSLGKVIFHGLSCDIPDSLYLQLADKPVKFLTYGITGFNVILNGNLEKGE